MVFQKGNKQACRQVFLRESKLFEKRHIIFSPIYCQKQPSKNDLRNSSSALVVKNYSLRTSIFKFVNILNKSSGDRTLKASRKTELIFIFYNTHTSQKCRVNVIRDTVMLHVNDTVNFSFILWRSFRTREDMY